MKRKIADTLSLSLISSTLKQYKHAKQVFKSKINCLRKNLTKNAKKVAKN